MKKWQSGKFWLKTLSTCLTGSILAGIAGYTALYQASSPERLQQAAEAAIAGSGRHIRFDADIGRSLFPRPTFTLRNLTISEPNDSKAAIHVGEVRTGIAWTSLFNATPAIEKWIWIKPDIHLYRRADGEWSLADLARHTHQSTVNRLIIEDGRIHIEQPERTDTLTALYAKISGLSAAESQFEAKGETEQPFWQTIKWQFAGTVEHLRPQSWHIPNFTLKADAAPAGHALTIKADTAITRNTDGLQTGTIKLQADSPDDTLHLNAESSGLHWQNGRLRLGETNGLATVRQNDSGWDGSINISQIDWRPTLLLANQIQLKASQHTPGYLNTFDIGTAVSWQNNRGILLDGFKLSTRQENRHAAGQARFISQLEGQLSSADGWRWQADLQGQIDRQRASVQADYQVGTPASLRLSLYLSKFSLTPYWENLQDEGSNRYPAWLTDGRLANVQADIRIDTLSTPGITIDNFATLLEADRRQIRLSSLTAMLYGGHTKGSITLSNANPPALQLQQHFQNVQINPLLQNLLGLNNLSGKGDAVVDLNSKGRNRAEWLNSLGGQVSIKVKNGSLAGVDLAKILQNLRQNQTEQPIHDNQQTPFERFTLESQIQNGISHPSRSELVSGNVTVVSEGKTDFSRETLQEKLTVNVHNQGRSSSIPLNLSGSFSAPAVSLDYQRLTDGLSTPEEKQQALSNALKEQWQWLKPERNSPDSGSPP